jgi:hypothetical protein
MHRQAFSAVSAVLRLPTAPSTDDDQRPQRTQGSKLQKSAAEGPYVVNEPLVGGNAAARGARLLLVHVALLLEPLAHHRVGAPLLSGPFPSSIS